MYYSVAVTLSVPAPEISVSSLLVEPDYRDRKSYSNRKADSRSNRSAGVNSQSPEGNTTAADTLCCSRHSDPGRGTGSCICAIINEVSFYRNGNASVGNRTTAALVSVPDMVMALEMVSTGFLALVTSVRALLAAVVPLMVGWKEPVNAASPIWRQRMP
ncbi:hypothetical protein [Chitinophaga pinensis]|uniref:hypothetical protein n=1 Tax=Chitinophaga pinensis TaxID=79329 RepID=UPI001C9A011F|nr:hypothetical protein [Chitinophaga pinensis]